MRTTRLAGLCLALSLLTGLSVGAADPFSPYVDGEGRISLPNDFRQWAFLGTWAVDSDEEDGGVAGFHNVYTQPESAAAYRETGEFPDGTVLVKELFGSTTEDMTTGRVSRASQPQGWFVMVKDGRGRFPDNPLWGDGWGWALFNADDRINTVTTDYQADCLGCHVPAQQTDWVYVQGYPVLQD